MRFSPRLLGVRHLGHPRQQPKSMLGKDAGVDGSHLRGPDIRLLQRGLRQTLHKVFPTSTNRSLTGSSQDSDYNVSTTALAPPLHSLYATHAVDSRGGPWGRVNTKNVRRDGARRNHKAGRANSDTHGKASAMPMRAQPAVDASKESRVVGASTR